MAAAAAAIRPTIAALCRVLARLGVGGGVVVPETLRAAKFDSPDSTPSLWRALHDLVLVRLWADARAAALLGAVRPGVCCEGAAAAGLSALLALPAALGRAWEARGSDAAARGFASRCLAVLGCPCAPREDCASSRRLLLALGWLMAQGDELDLLSLFVRATEARALFDSSLAPLSVVDDQALWKAEAVAHVEAVKLRPRDVKPEARHQRLLLLQGRILVRLRQTASELERRAALAHELVEEQLRAFPHLSPFSLRSTVLARNATLREADTVSMREWLADSELCSSLDEHEALWWAWIATAAALEAKPPDQAVPRRDASSEAAFRVLQRAAAPRGEEAGAGAAAAVAASLCERSFAAALALAAEAPLGAALRDDDARLLLAAAAEPAANGAGAKKELEAARVEALGELDAMRELRPRAFRGVAFRADV
jgi:hypothetical protein